MDWELVGKVLAAAVGAIVVALLAIYRTNLFDTERVVADRNAVKIIRKLLAHPQAPFRSFAMLRHHIGGYQDDELRKLLVRAGAIRVISEDDRELWILVTEMVKRTKRGDSFEWIIRKTPATPPDSALFPAKLQGPGS
jgi:hypothetical protein